VRREAEGGRREAGAGRESLSHERLDAYKLARGLAVDLFKATAAMSAADRFGISSQIRRSAVSIPANIAEGAARKSKKEYVQFLSTARGSSAELRVLLDIAHETGQLSEDLFRAFENKVDRISSMISGLIRRNRA
jgi:four helix bundle protein